MSSPSEHLSDWRDGSESREESDAHAGSNSARVRRISSLIRSTSSWRIRVGAGEPGWFPPHCLWSLKYSVNGEARGDEECAQTRLLNVRLDGLRAGVRIAESFCSGKSAWTLGCNRRPLREPGSAILAAIFQITAIEGIRFTVGSARQRSSITQADPSVLLIACKA